MIIAGLLIFGDEAALGEDVKNIIPIDDVIYEVDNKSLTNRPDLWGHYGIAREIAAITGRKLKPLYVENIEKYNDLETLNLSVEAEDENPLCLRYSAIRIENVTKKMASWKMKVRLYYCGMRSINLLADMTNYIMMELGQPMHAFDANKVHSINVRTLREETDFVTLDEEKRTLDKGVLMIANENEPVAIAGVMGGLNTEIEDETTSVFLESANFDATNIRKTASKYNLRTDAAAHYEKTLDPELTKTSIERFITVLKEEDPDIKVTSAFSDIYLKRYPHIVITIDKDYIDRSIGKELSMEEITTTLTNLEYGLKVDGKVITIDVPSFRATKDVSQKADIIEEIARIHGYDNIEPKTNLWKVAPIEKDPVRELEYSIKELLAVKYGMSEIHSYVWYSFELNKKLGIKVEDNLKITNGIVKEDNTLRRDMAPTMLYAVYKNIKYMPEVKVFEVGRTFDYNFDLKNAIEHKVLGAAIASNNKEEKELVFEAKKMAQDILKINKNISARFINRENIDKSWMHPFNTFDILIDEKYVGYISLVHPKISDNINAKTSIAILELDVDKIGSLAKNNIKFKEVSKFQTVTFDLSLIASSDVKYDKIENIIKSSNMKYLQEYSLIDIYEDSKKLFGKKTYTIRFTIYANDKTLTKEEIDSDREEVLNSFKQNGIYINE
ncbi:MAG: phenylalanine--tRNA ligase subunit beta [Clostridia bacterium]|nr:phenylalanine--tRNA ligase subunit beta [Clostridia bacterium]